MASYRRNEGIVQRGGKISAHNLAVGRGASIHDDKPAGDIDLRRLATELAVLRGQLKAQATEPEHDVAVGAVAAAERAAKQGNASSALGHLKEAGSWALGVATKVGVPVAVAALKQALGV